jgi:hypothetical protein
MRPFYARVSHVGPRDFVPVGCVYGLTELSTRAMLTTAGLTPFDLIKELARRAIGEGQWGGPTLLVLFILQFLNLGSGE